MYRIFLGRRVGGVGRPSPERIGPLGILFGHDLALPCRSSKALKGSVAMRQGHGIPAKMLRSHHDTTVGGQNPAPVEEQTHVHPRAPSLTLS